MYKLNDFAQANVVQSDLNPAIHAAFNQFRADTSLLALPITLANNTLQAQSPVPNKDHEASLQTNLNELDAVLSARTPMYLLLRRDDSLVAITYVPYLAKEAQRAFLLEHRHEFVRQFGEAHFSQSLICKEIGEITDARSWEERDSQMTGHDKASEGIASGESCKDGCCNKDDSTIKDMGYKRNKCRLCDRRMKNKIAPDALSALKTLKEPGIVVQIAVDLSTEILTLTHSALNASPESISSFLPTTTPTFTFFHHPTHAIIYFIFHSPDSATVQARMKHTMAIPGLLVHAEDVGVVVDRKIEIHEPDELVFEGLEIANGGRFRSMFNRKGFEGTELQYRNMERDKKLLDALG
ncbi:hypothetical protein EK21DRAFT_71505 [Setomelanomma holmii]|uniref:ADF-H domain-containing protein n=1 Tax=Setomelanomma holmii TaxID=210430 RepID=A0A9P4H4Y1_9PLEO|nr:hypothetical protein EK21DRAFT_71505 [Setomelanomma holmii]